MAAPYGCIVVLHIAILFGAFVITALGSPVFILKSAVKTKIFTAKAQRSQRER
jgi:hypothetical protein